MIVEMEILTRLVLAAVIGSALGLERKMHNKPGGTRTHALVCLGSTLFTIVSMDFSSSVLTPGASVSSDPSRIAAGIVTGIGFLGAGTIFKTKSRVLGLTTAAELWAVAAIGIAVGAGMYFVCIAAAIIVFMILVQGKMVESEITKKKHKHKWGSWM